jgi:hypothetical protein
VQGSRPPLQPRPPGSASLQPHQPTARAAERLSHQARCSPRAACCPPHPHTAPDTPALHAAHLAAVTFQSRAYESKQYLSRKAGCARVRATRRHSGSCARRSPRRESASRRQRQG